MTLKTKVEKYLESEPRARERRFKDRAIANMLLSKYPQLTVSKEMLIEIIGDAANMDRYWRMTLKDRPDLRGTDYDTKEIVEQEKMLELGYQPGYYQDIRR